MTPDERRIMTYISSAARDIDSTTAAEAAADVTASVSADSVSGEADGAPTHIDTATPTVSAWDNADVSANRAVSSLKD